MSADNLMQILHDRATRGESLSETEKVQLDAWYKAQDEGESDLLSKNEAQKSIAQKQDQIHTVACEIKEVRSKIQEISAENKILQQENEVLREKLAEKLSLKIV